MKKATVAIITLFILMSSIVAVSAELTASISLPRMVLYKNITSGEKISFENLVGIINRNNHTIDISIAPAGVWEGRVNISEPEFSMAPGETKDVNYTISIEKAGYYSGKIIVTFSEKESKNTLDMPQMLVVIVQDENGKVPGEIKDAYNGSDSRAFKKIYILWAVAVIAIIALIIAIIKLSGKANEK